MKTNLATLLCFASLRIAFAQTDWEYIGEKEGVKVYRRDVPGSDVLAFKGSGEVDQPLSRVATVVVDMTRATEWVDSLEGARVVRKIKDTPTEQEFIEYDHIGTPIVMKDRDFVSHVRIKHDPENDRMTMSLNSIEDPLAPPTKYVRGELIKSEFVLEAIDGGKRTRVSGEIHCDPKGSVPKWIVNFFQKDWPRQTVNSLRKQSAKPDVNPPEQIRKFYP
jgi:hypothetical protein